MHIAALEGYTNSSNQSWKRGPKPTKTDDHAQKLLAGILRGFEQEPQKRDNEQQHQHIHIICWNLAQAKPNDAADVSVHSWMGMPWCIYYLEDTLHQHGELGLSIIVRAVQGVLVSPAVVLHAESARTCWEAIEITLSVRQKISTPSTQPSTSRAIHLEELYIVMTKFPKATPMATEWSTRCQCAV